MDSPRDEPVNRPHRETQKFQFNLRTLLILTASIAVFLAVVTQFGFPPFLFVLIVCGLPVVMIPFTLYHCVHTLHHWVQWEVDAISFNIPLRCANILLVSIYSVVMLALATVAFVPEWQGDKGQHWFYYLNDGPAGWSTFPIFVAGAVSFAWSIIEPRYALRSPTNLALIAINAVICWWYTIATMFFSFAKEGRIAAFVPLVCALNYSCYCALLARNVASRWTFKELKSLPLVGWFLCVLTSIVVKIPLAQAYYASLPPNPPSGCFIVTAASRGHRWLVGSFQEAGTGRTINRQLCVFWEFERWLQTHLPGFHRCLRALYNRFGPLLARMIHWRWQADIVFVILLPCEVLLRFVGFGRSIGTATDGIDRSVTRSRAETI